jgi:hypothetical protein
MPVTQPAGGVAYLTTISIDGGPHISLWRAVSGGGDLWFERYGHEGWREDEKLGDAVHALGTVRLTKTEALGIAHEHFGRAW